MALMDIATALTTAVKEALPDVLIAEENVGFAKQSPAGTWAILRFRPNIPTVATLGSQGRDRVNGFLQLDLYAELAAGEKETAQVYEQLRSVFVAGATFNHNGQSVSITGCEKAYSRNRDGYWFSPFTVYWYSFISRTNEGD